MSEGLYWNVDLTEEIEMIDPLYPTEVSHILIMSKLGTDKQTTKQINTPTYKTQTNKRMN